MFTTSFLTLQPHAWRAAFAECLLKLRLEQWEFRLFFLRRRVTIFLLKSVSLDQVLLAGRWPWKQQIPNPPLSPFPRIFHKGSAYPGCGRIHWTAPKVMVEYHDGSIIQINLFNYPNFPFNHWDKRRAKWAHGWYGRGWLSQDSVSAWMALSVPTWKRGEAKARRSCGK